MTTLVVVGGSDAGVSAALAAREVDPRAQIAMVLADAYPNFSVCGLPFFLSGEVADWRALAHRTREEILAHRIDLRPDTRADEIDPARRVLWVRDPTRGRVPLPYDRLVVATGAEPVRPPVAGLDLPGVFQLHTMEEGRTIHAWLTAAAPRRALVVGAGYIGLELADALTRRGVAVTVVEAAPAPLPTVDRALGERVGALLRAHGVGLVTGVKVSGIAATTSGLLVRGEGGWEGTADMVLVVVGVRPRTDLARTAGIAPGPSGALAVGRTMATSVPDVWAAGDCVETYHRLLRRSTYLPLGTTAHKQGRVAGINAMGGAAQFAGSLGTQVVKVFDSVVARTGLRDEEALTAGWDPVTVETTAWDHKAYYPGARELTLRLTGDRRSGRLLGAQLLGPPSSAKRIDILATALYHGMAVEELSDLDLGYTPPVASPWDPVQAAAQAWIREGRPARA